MGLFRELGTGAKPWWATEIALKLELESRRDRWTLRPGDLYRGGGDYFLRHGQFFHGRALPDKWASLMGPEGNCFENAARAALAHPELRYFEGVYGDQGNFTPHGWCVDQDGEVVEVTYLTRDDQGRGDHVAGNNALGIRLGAPERIGYWGVELNPELVIWFATEHDGGVCMFDRPAYDQADLERKGMDAHQSHDVEILRYPYDPNMKEFPRGPAQAP